MKQSTPTRAVINTGGSLASIRLQLNYVIDDVNLCCATGQGTSRGAGAVSVAEGTWHFQNCGKVLGPTRESRWGHRKTCTHSHGLWMPCLRPAGNTMPLILNVLWPDTQAERQGKLTLTRINALVLTHPAPFTGSSRKHTHAVYQACSCRHA